MTTKVLVHCHAGISRSPTAVIYYFMRKYQIDYEAAMQMVNRKRRVAPSDQFVDMLRNRCHYVFRENKKCVVVF